MIQYQRMETNLDGGSFLPVSVHLRTMYGRGSDDDKGTYHSSSLTALRNTFVKWRFASQYSPLSSVKGQRSASTDWMKYFVEHKKHLRGADLLVWETRHPGIIRVSWKFPVVAKGSSHGYSVVKSAEVDIHSSLWWQ